MLFKSYQLVSRLRVVRRYIYYTSLFVRLSACVSIYTLTWPAGWLTVQNHRLKCIYSVLTYTVERDNFRSERTTSLLVVGSNESAVCVKNTPRPDSRIDENLVDLIIGDLSRRCRVRNNNIIVVDNEIV